MPRASTARTPDEQTDRGGAIVSVQNLLLLPDYSGPQPDVAVLRPREDFYAEAHPKPGDVLLLIEVSDTTLRYDREVKLPLYALAGIPEVCGSWTSRTRRS